MKIIQVLDYYAGGNAVANCAVTYHRFAERMGIESVIVSRLIDKQDSFVTGIEYLANVTKEDIIMYHMCIGTPLNIDICDYQCKKVLVYHNITPPHLMGNYNRTIAEACEEGLKQLLYMQPYFDLCLADSEFNKSDLIKAGYDKDKIAVIPPLVSRDDFLKKPDEKVVKKMNDGWVNVLFVGRVNPNKKHEDIIRAYSCYKQLNPKSRLILAGGVTDGYYENLVRYVRENEIKDVIFTKQISFAALIAYYKTASVFLCMSEHEGYCIPLIEAMLFDIPVIGYDAGAVGDTMGGSGVLVNDKNPRYIARIIDKIVTDKELHQKIVEQQQNYLKTLTEDAIYEMYKKWIEVLPSELKKSTAVRFDQVEIPINVNPYDVVMVIKATDWPTAKLNLKYIRENLNPKRIVVISSSKIREYLTREDNVVYINEDRLYPGLSFAGVRQVFQNMGLANAPVGWFLQQFLKFAYAYVCEDEYYLTWDADTLPLRKINMFDDEGRPCFDMKPEYIEPYFNTINNLFGMQKVEEESFIAEHMLFDKKIVQELISSIENNTDLQGKVFYEKIICSTDFSKQFTSFSEFETYGTYCEYFYPDKYTKRHINTFRSGKMFLGEAPSESVLQWVAKEKDTISFEVPQRVIESSYKLSRQKKFRDKYSLNQLVTRTHFFDSLLDRPWLKEEEAALNMDYPWAVEPEFKSKKENQVCNGKVLVDSPDDYRIIALSQLLSIYGYDVHICGNTAFYENAVADNAIWGSKTLCRNGIGACKIVRTVNDEQEYDYILMSACNKQSVVNVDRSKKIYKWINGKKDISNDLDIRHTYFFVSSHDVKCSLMQKRIKIIVSSESIAFNCDGISQVSVYDKQKFISSHHFCEMVYEEYEHLEEICKRDANILSSVN